MKKVHKIVIVGGGTAGWITASWFARRWSQKIDITIIDKYEPERVGVGEATLLSFPSVMQKMGFRVEDWMNSCLLYTSPSPRDGLLSRMPSSA